MSITLQNSGVEFIDSTHQYFLNGKELKGITGVLHRCLFPDMYKAVDDETLKRAAQAGSVVHEQIELYDTLGLEPSVPEGKAYIKLKAEQGYETVANEYIVTNSIDYASGVDLVMHKVGSSESEVELWDIKHTYNVNRAYVEWQLSIYKAFFEAQNPGLNVTAIKCLWLRDDKTRGLINKVIPLTPHHPSEVEKLLECDRGGELYQGVDKSTECVMSNEQRLVWLNKTIAQLSAEKDEILSEILGTMHAEGATTVKTPFLCVSRVESSTSTTLDTRKLKEADTEAFDKLIKLYPKVTMRKESIRLTFPKD